MSKHNKILSLLTAIRDSFVGAEVVYTQGSCYKLYKIIKTTFPSAKAFHIKGVSHIVTQIDGKYYDINGERSFSEKELIAVGEEGYVEDNEGQWHDCSDWIFNIYDVHVECPACDESFYRGELKPEHIKQTRKRYEHKR